MAPMAGINVPSFCELLISNGCDFIYSALLTSYGIVRENKKTMEMKDTLPAGVDLVVQIFGGVPEVMAEAAAALDDPKRFAAIDVNMGCPAPKVIKCGGVALMKTPELAGRVVRAVAEKTSLPVTVKMRLGWDEASINFIELARICIDNGRRQSHCTRARARSALRANRTGHRSRASRKRSPCR